MNIIRSIFICVAVVFFLHSYLHAGDFYNPNRKLSVIDNYIDSFNRLISTNPDSSKYYAQKALELSQNSIDSGRSFQMLGRVRIELNDLDFGFKNLNDARKLFEETSYKPGLIDIYSDIGQLFYRYSNFQKAKEYYQKALFLKAESLEEDKELMNIYYYIGIIESNLGNLESSFSYFDKLLKYFENTNDTTSYAYIIIEYAKVLSNADNNVKSNDLLLSFVNKSQTKKTDFYSQLALNNYRLGQVSSAIDFATLELRASKTSSDSVKCLSNLMAYYMLENKYKEAEDCYLIAEGMEVALDRQIQFDLNLVELFLKTGNNDKAIKLFEETLNTVLDSNMTDYYSDILNSREMFSQYKITKDFSSNKFISKLLSCKSTDMSLAFNSSSKLINLIAQSDKEIENKNQIIELSGYYNKLLLAFIFLLILSLSTIVHKQMKLRKYLNSLTLSYNIVSEKVNNDLRMLLQKLLIIDEDLGQKYNVKHRISKDLKPLLDDIKNLLDVLIKPLINKIKK